MGWLNFMNLKICSAVEPKIKIQRWLMHSHSLLSLCFLQKLCEVFSVQKSWTTSKYYSSNVGIRVDSCWHAYSNLSTLYAAILPVVLLIKITDDNIPSLILMPTLVSDSQEFKKSIFSFHYFGISPKFESNYFDTNSSRAGIEKKNIILIIHNNFRVGAWQKCLEKHFKICYIFGIRKSPFFSFRAT